MDTETRRQLATDLAGLIEQMDGAHPADKIGAGAEDNDALRRAYEIAGRFGFTINEIRMALRAAEPTDPEALVRWLGAHAGPGRASEDAGAAQMLNEGQEEVFSRAEVELGVIEHNTKSGPAPDR